MKTRLLHILISLALLISLCGCTAQPTYEEGYQEGYDAGFDEGYDIGYSDGYTDAEVEVGGYLPSGSDSTQDDLSGDIVYITDYGSKYHRDGCPSLYQSKTPIGKSDAISRGYGACSRCSP